MSVSRGFALPAVLATLTALGAIAVSVMPKGVAGVFDAAAVERRLQERLLLEAGITRGILALLEPDDPLTQILRQDGSAPWDFAGRRLIIGLRAESAKLDLNAADPGALAQALDQALGSKLGEDATQAARDRRGALTRPEQILPLAQRFSAASVRLRDALTVYGGQTENGHSEIDPADGSVLHAVNERPIYTVRARIGGASRALGMIVLIDPERRRYAIVERIEFTASDRESAQ